MFHCATVTGLEFEALKRIESVVRKGHVTRITGKNVTLDHGSYEPIPDTLYVDCSAGGVPKVDAVPVFRHHNITLQPVRTCQQTFSAAMIAHVEATYKEQKLKNELCGPVPMPNEPTDIPLVMLQTNLNTISWLSQPQTILWLASCRLDITRRPLPEDLEQRRAQNKRTLDMLKAVNKKIRHLFDQLPEREAANMHRQLKDLSLGSSRL
jgi:hypothetical protein